MLNAITAAITPRTSLINTCFSGDLGRGDRTFADIMEFFSKSLTIEVANNHIDFWIFCHLLTRVRTYGQTPVSTQIHNPQSTIPNLKSIHFACPSLLGEITYAFTSGISICNSSHKKLRQISHNFCYLQHNYRR